MQSGFERIADYSLDANNILNIVFQEESSYKLVNMSINELEKLIKTIDNGKYKLKISFIQAKDSATGMTEQDKAFIEDMFGDKFTYKKYDDK